MSVRHLSKLVDDVSGRGAIVNEGVKTVIIANLKADDARAIIESSDRLGWSSTVADAHEGLWSKDELGDDLEPFRATIIKASENDIVPVVSKKGFEQLLNEPSIQSRCWAVAGLAAPIRTWTTLFLPWGKTETPAEPPPTKNPRFLVKEYTTERTVPSDIGRWLLRAPSLDRGIADEYRQVWAEAATRNLLSCLPNEIDPETNALRFRGPPRLSLEKPENTEVIDFASSLDFDQLQLASTWIFESVRDTEVRHALLASEIARSGMDQISATTALRKDLEAALDGARIAYEMSLASIGADTLKALSDLRKGVTEETAKVTEATRQTVTAVSSALAVGVGLIAAKATSTVSILLIGALMIVALLYVGMVAASGWQFVALQRKARESWQARLYRFLPKDDYNRLVTEPTSHAECVFKSTVAIGVVAVSILAGALIFVDRSAQIPIESVPVAPLHPPDVQASPSSSAGP
ncbi:hypothetical protein [Rhizobium sp. S163]|uniref:hypothetical protein n=1 Tax=Rhizobium sp. S163 TaxID=3055039 RepID=UPI0025A994A4|nr:hypothetical protein [Rhizobium sp. S163]MDM9645508.1 hypothetical protein [Rhizobium sp. S163]